VVAMADAVKGSTVRGMCVQFGGSIGEHSIGEHAQTSSSCTWGTCTHTHTHTHMRACMHTDVDTLPEDPLDLETELEQR
jgi:hypothetical protein